MKFSDFAIANLSFNGERFIIIHFKDNVKIMPVSEVMKCFGESDVVMFSNDNVWLM